MPVVAVLGLGSIGKRHARNLLALGCQVVGYDPSPGCMTTLQSNGGQPAASRQEALGRADAVVICTPNGDHLGDLAAAVAAAKPTLVEKPLAHTDRGVEAILAEADHKHVPILVGFNLRQHPAVKRARELLEGGEFGRPLWARFTLASYLPDWRPGQDHRLGYAADPRTGGVVFDAIHEFDLSHFLLGPGEVRAAVARCTGAIDIRSDDCAEAVLQHDGGAMSSIHLDYVTRPTVRAGEIGLERGLLRLDLIGRRVTLARHDGEIAVDESFPGSFADDYMSEMRHFLACVDGREKPGCDGWQGLAALRTALSVRRFAGLPH